MRKFIVLLCLIFVVTACQGSSKDSVDIKYEGGEEIVEKFIDTDWEDIEKALSDSGYTMVNGEYGTYYMKASAVKEDSVTSSVMDSELLKKVGDIIVVSNSDGSYKGFVGSNKEKVDDGYLMYNVSISEKVVSLKIVLNNLAGENLCTAEYVFDGNQLTLNKDSTFGFNGEEYLKDYVEDGIEYFEEILTELDEVLSQI